jgi:hypothetical protein
MKTIDDHRVAESHGGGACPEQHWGTLIDGQIFYFRFRSNCAQLHLGVEGEELPVVDGSLWRLPVGYLNDIYPGEPLIGFFLTDEDRTRIFAECLDQIWKWENDTSDESRMDGGRHRSEGPISTEKEQD